MKKNGYILIILLLLAPRFIYAKKEKESPVWKISGGLNLSSQWYSINSEGPDGIRPRQPRDLHRVMFTPTLQAGDFQLPVTVVFSSRQTNSISMQATSQSFAQFMTNPMNTFSIAPSWKWAKAVIGSQTVSYSDFTTGNSRLFGAAMELTPGKWTLAAFHGISQRAIEPDSLLRIPGAFQRNFTAARAGYGSPNGFQLFVNMAYMNDDPENVPDASEKLKPQQGLATSLVVAIPLGAYILWSNEAAVSFFTKDKNAESYSFNQGTIPFLFLKPRISSRTDHAFQSSVSYRRTVFSLNLKATYVGDGFMAPGFPYMQTDRMDITFSPRLRILENRVVMSATVGYRKNNLSNTKLQTSSQLLMAMQVNATFTPQAGVNGSFSNFGMRTTHSMDTLRMEMIATSVSLAPWWHIKAHYGTHQISASLSLDHTEETNLVTARQMDRQTFSVLLNHSFLFDNRPMNTEFAVSYMNNNAMMGVRNYHIQPGLSYRLWNRKMQSSLRFAYINSKMAEHTPDHSFMIRPGIRLLLSRQWTARADASIRVYRYGSARDLTGFTENIFRTSVNYRF